MIMEQEGQLTLYGGTSCSEGGQKGKSFDRGRGKIIFCPGRETFSRWKLQRVLDRKPGGRLLEKN